LALFGCLTPVKDTDAGLGVLGSKVAVLRVVQRRCERRAVELKRRVVVGHAHDVPLYKVQTAWQRAEFYAIELYVYTVVRELGNNV
jgi:hypothetical protein